MGALLDLPENATILRGRTGTVPIESMRLITAKPSPDR